MALRLNVNGLTNEFLNIFEQELDDALNRWKTELFDNLKHRFYFKYAQASHEIHRQSKMVVAYLKANPYVLADSYGTGSLMLSDNPGFSEYMRNAGSGKGQVNPARTGKAIAGRPKGRYVDMFGREHETSGVFEGKNIEGKTVYKRKKGLFDTSEYKIEPTSPSRAIQIAEELLYKQWIPIAYNNTMRRLNIAKFLIES